MIEFKFNAEDFERAMKDHPENLVKYLRRASKKEAASIENGAKQKHRFTSRTGRLVKSIKGYGGVEIDSKELAFVELVLHDEGQPLGTEYGKYVHEGHGSWGADRFIFDAMNRRKKNILRSWSEAIARANKEF